MSVATHKVHFSQYTIMHNYPNIILFISGFAICLSCDNIICIFEFLLTMPLWKSLQNHSQLIDERLIFTVGESYNLVIV